MGYSKAEEKALKKMRKVRTVRKRIRPKEVLEVDMVGFILADIPEFEEEISSDNFALVVEDDKLYVTFNTRGVHSEDPNVPEEEMTPTDAFLEFCAFKKRGLTKPAYPEFAKKYAGRTFHKAAYRFYDKETGERMQRLMEETYFPEEGTNIRVFASDWRGRQYAIDPNQKRRDGQSSVVMFEIEELAIYDLQVTFSEFHSTEMFIHNDFILDTHLQNNYNSIASWSQFQNVDNCAGMVTPKMLGGQIDFYNLQPTDMNNYWRTMSKRLSSSETVETYHSPAALYKITMRKQPGGK